MISELIPNRVFVSGLSVTTSENELKEYFSNLIGAGNVKEVKIIMDIKGVSKGFGFITFETENEASNLIANNPETLLFKDAKLNIAHAYKRRMYQNNQYKNTGISSNFKRDAVTIQTETENNSERYFLSPTSGKFLNLVSPNSPQESHIRSQNNESADPTQNCKTDEHTSLEKQNNTDTDGVIEPLILTDVRTNNSVELSQLTKEDDNNNTIKLPDSKTIIDAQQVDESNKQSPNNTSSIIRKDNNNNHYPNKYPNSNRFIQRSKNFNQRNFNAYFDRNNYNKSQYQNEFNKCLTVQTQNSKNSKSYNGQLKSTPNNFLNKQQFVHNSPIQYYYAMAAAALTGGIHSPAAQQQSLLQTNSNPPRYQTNPRNQQRNKYDTKLSSKSSSDYVGSITNCCTSINHSDQASVKVQTNYQQMSSCKKSPKSPFNDTVTNQNQQASSVRSCSTSSSSPASHQLKMNEPVTQNSYSANTAAVNFVNHTASINSATLQPPLPLSNKSESSTDYVYTNNQYAPMLNKQPQYAVYPSYYYYQVNANNIPQNTNSVPIYQVDSNNNNTTSSAASTNSSEALTPHSQCNSSQSIYYPSGPNEMNNIYQQQPVISSTDTGFHYSAKQSTITNAFETATSSSTDNKSTDNLENLMQKNLTLQSSSGDYNNNQAPQQPITQGQYYYLPQTGFIPNTNGQVPVTQYYYYYAPAPTGTSNNPVQTYQIPMQQPVLINQQSISNANFSAQTGPKPYNYPIQINTINNQPAGTPLQTGPLSAPSNYFNTVTYTNQQSQHSTSGAQVPISVPLLNLPPEQCPPSSSSMYQPIPMSNQRMVNIQSPNQHGTVLNKQKNQYLQNGYQSNQIKSLSRPFNTNQIYKTTPIQHSQFNQNINANQKPQLNTQTRYNQNSVVNKPYQNSYTHQQVNLPNAQANIQHEMNHKPFDMQSSDQLINQQV